MSKLEHALITITMTATGAFVGVYVFPWVIKKVAPAKLTAALNL